MPITAADRRRTVQLLAGRGSLLWTASTVSHWVHRTLPVATLSIGRQYWVLRLSRRLWVHPHRSRRRPR